MYLKNSSGKALQDPYFLKIHTASFPVFGKASIKKEQYAISKLIFELITLKKERNKIQTCGIIKCKINEESGDSTGLYRWLCFPCTSLAWSHTKRKTEKWRVCNHCWCLRSQGLEEHLGVAMGVCNLRIDIH